MTNSNYLWQSNQDLSQACLQHPFFRRIADQEFLDGTSPRIYPWNQSLHLKSKILKPPDLSVGSIQNLKSKI
jgi:hypothetical protein